MTSPIPGMDPYLEQPDLWPDFRNNQAVEIQGRLNAPIQLKYFAGPGTYATDDVIDVELSMPVSRHAMRPDVSVSAQARWPGAP